MDPSRQSQSEPPAVNNDRIDAHVGWTLLAGLVLSIGVMALGLIWAAVTGDTGTGHVLPLDQILPHLGEAQASAVLDLGIVLLFATPLAGVVVALAEFVWSRDLPFIVITALLLLVLAAGFAVALR